MATTKLNVDFWGYQYDKTVNLAISGEGSYEFSIKQAKKLRKELDKAIKTAKGDN